MQKYKIMESSLVVKRGYLKTEEGRGDRDTERPDSAEVHKIEVMAIFPDLRQHIFLSHHLEYAQETDESKRENKVRDVLSAPPRTRKAFLIDFAAFLVQGIKEPLTPREWRITHLDSLEARRHGGRSEELTTVVPAFASFF